MNKKRIKTIFLVLLPILAAGMAVNPGSVMLYDAAQDKMSACSYFALLPEGNFQIATVLAGILTCLSGGLAITYLVGKKASVAKAIVYISLAGASLAAIPILINSPIRVLPNVGVPILLVAQAVVAYFVPEKKTENKKLKSRKSL